MTDRTEPTKKQLRKLAAILSTRDRGEYVVIADGTAFGVIYHDGKVVEYVLVDRAGRQLTNASVSPL